MKPARRGAKLVLGCVVLFLVYLGTAHLGLVLGAVAGFATLVWPPTGIALAALRLFGFSLWPGVFAGALVVNFAHGAPFLAACGIACGNTLEALLGACLLGRIRFQPGLDRVLDVMALILLAAIASTTVSAFIGVGSLWLGGVVASAEVGRALRAWWVGDALGDLVVAPLLFVFRARPPLRKGRAMVAEAALLVVTVVMFGALVFGNLFVGSATVFRYPYLLFPLFVWAALRFGQYGAVISVFLVSVIAVTGTTMGFGPFAQPVLSESLLGLQAFTAVAAATALVLGAAVAERNRAVDARDEFLSIASHELRTPLTALSLHVQALIHRLRPELEVDREQMLKSMEAARRLVARLAKLIGDLLEVSRVTTGTFQLRREEMDLGVSVRESLARFEGQLASSGSRVEVQSKGRLTGRWDPTRLDQVIDNLISNAVKYGGGKPVVVELSENGERVVLEVRDQGIGINPADQSRIFERFERAVSRRRFGGFGLGLWITRKVVEAHGGTIHLVSAPGLGSTFRVELPK